jgi:hypothetical protein
LSTIVFDDGVQRLIGDHYSNLYDNNLRSKATFITIVACVATACVIVALIVRRRAQNKNRLKRAIAILRDFENQCSTPVHKLRHVVDSLIVEMNAGLASEGGSKLKMLLSYVDNLPTGYALTCTLNLYLFICIFSCL